MQSLTKQELHNLGMNIIGKKLQKMGYEFIAINSNLKKHPQFVLFKKGEKTIFVLVKVSNNNINTNNYNVIWKEKFKEHSIKQKAKIWYAGIGITNAKNKDLPVIKNKPYCVYFNGFVEIL